MGWRAAWDGLRRTGDALRALVVLPGRNTEVLRFAQDDGGWPGVADEPEGALAWSWAEDGIRRSFASLRMTVGGPVSLSLMSFGALALA